MENKSACFTGHRDIRAASEEHIREKLVTLLQDLIGKGYTDFYNGGALGFDLLSAEAVLELREKYPQIKLHFIMPCNNQTRGWREESIIRYQSIRERADEVKCLSSVYYDGCMQARNRYMVDNSELCIAYLERATGGSAYTARYAEKNGVTVINIADKA